jgi:hypothetical protein
MISLLSKQGTRLTQQEREALLKPLGVVGVPYPEAARDGTTDALDLHMSGPIGVISTRAYEDVAALAYTNMPVWSLLEAERKIMEKMNPDSSGFFTLVISGPGWGKTEGAQNAAVLMDNRPQPYVFVNCANRNLEELLWETVIDFGDDYKTALFERIENGTLKPSSYRVLEEQFAGALIRDAFGKITGIDESKTAVPKDKETNREALERDLDHLRLIAENENIPRQTQNTLGIRKVFNRTLEKAMTEGRILIWDEFTKDEQGTEAALLEFVQWANGMGRDTITVRSTFSVNGRNETAERTLSRSDRAVGFQIVATGNPADPMLKRFESSPILSRMDIVRMDDPTHHDWEHRTSQLLTGVPLSTHFAFLSSLAANQEEFAELLLEWREAKARIDGREMSIGQIARIRNWPATRLAVEKIAAAVHYVERLFDTKSGLHVQDLNSGTPALDNVRSEIRSGFASSHPIDPRLLVRFIQEAESGRELSKKIGEESSAKPAFDRSVVGRKASITPKNPLMVQAEFGTRLQAVIERWVNQVTAGMPETRKVVQKEMHDRGVAFTTPQQDNTLSTLLNQDMFSHIGGVQSVLSLQRAFAEKKRSADKSVSGRSDNDLVPMDEATAICEQLSLLQTNDNTNPAVGQMVILGDDTREAFKKVAAVDSIGQTQELKPSQLVRTSDFFEALKVPKLANINMQAIWRRTLSNDNRIPQTEPYTQLTQIAEATHPTKIGITTLVTRDESGDVSAMHVMFDGERKRSLVVTEGVDQETRAALGKDYTIVSFADADAQDRISGFIRDTLGHPARRDQSAELEGQLTAAFLLRAGNTKDIESLAKMMAQRDTEVTSPVFVIEQLGLGS